jgi:hypothetical protein
MAGDMFFEEWYDGPDAHVTGAAGPSRLYNGEGLPLIKRVLRKGLVKWEHQAGDDC